MPNQPDKASDTAEQLGAVLKGVLADEDVPLKVRWDDWQRGVVLMLYAVISGVIGLYALSVDARYAPLLGVLTAVLLILAGREFDQASRSSSRGSAAGSRNDARRPRRLRRIR